MADHNAGTHAMADHNAAIVATVALATAAAVAVIWAERCHFDADTRRFLPN
jgi:hypothetical protein